MMSAWWLLPAAMAGCAAGMIAHALCQMGKEHSEDEQNSG